MKKNITITTCIATTLLSTTLFTSCTLDPEYREWKKKNKNASTDSTANPYGAPPAQTSNPYGVPQTGGEAAPYQRLPGVSDPTPHHHSDSPDPRTAGNLPATGGTQHTVVSGESLWGLARKYNTTIEAIQTANGLTSTNIRTGSTLTIPSR